MNAVISFVALLALLATAGLTPAADLQEPQFVQITMCDLYKDPARYAGKLVQVTATIRCTKDHILLDEPAFERHEDCDAGAYMILLLRFPTKEDRLRGLTLTENADLKAFRTTKGPARMEATLTGLFQPVFVWRNKQRIRVTEGRDPGGKKRFGDGTFVLLELSNYRSRPIPKR